MRTASKKQKRQWNEKLEAIKKRLQTWASSFFSAQDLDLNVQ